MARWQTVTAAAAVALLAITASATIQPPAPEMEQQVNGVFHGTDFKAEEGWFLSRIAFRECGRNLMDIRIAMSQVPYNTTCEMEEYRLIDVADNVAKSFVGDAPLPSGHYLKEVSMINVPLQRGCMAHRVSLKEIGSITVIAQIDGNYKTPVVHLLHPVKFWVRLTGVGKQGGYVATIPLVSSGEAKRTMDDLKQHFPEPARKTSQGFRPMKDSNVAEEATKKPSGRIEVPPQEDL